jgi:AcrR family transcriptional regulator
MHYVILNVNFIYSKYRQFKLGHSKPSTIKTQDKLGLKKADWIRSARKILIKEGIGKMSLRGLACDLKVTTGAFYWQYKNLEELHKDLRNDWEITNNAPFNRIFDGPIDNWTKTYLQYVRAIILETEYDPAYDNSIRNWAKFSTETAEVLQRVDTLRIEQLSKLYACIGYDDKRALVMANTTYYHQTGYFVIKPSDCIEARLANVPYYAELFTGHSLFPEPINVESIHKTLLEA